MQNLSEYRAGAFRALRHADFRRYLLGQTSSVAGSWMQITALSWLVYRLTGSSLALGSLAFIALLPTLPLALLGGSVADRFSKRNLLLITTTIAMVQAFMLAWLTWTGRIQIWHIFLLSFVLGASNAIEMGAREALTIELVGVRDLTSGVALTSSVWSVARIVGPVLGGVALASAGEAVCFVFNGITYLIALVTLAAIRRPRPRIVARTFSPVGDAKELSAFFFGRKEVAALMALVGLSATFAFAFDALLPAFAVDVLQVGPNAFGVLVAAFGVGSVLGAIGFASMDTVYGRGRLFAVGRLLAPLFLLLFSFSRNYLVSCALLVGAGIMLITQNGLGNPLIQTMAPANLRGRIMGVYALATIGMTRFGGMMLGAVADQIGAPLALGLSATVCLVVCALILHRAPMVFNLP
jgi:MFS family permease